MAHATQVIGTEDSTAAKKAISAAMGRHGMSVDESGDHPVWTRLGTNEAYPLVMECGISKDGDIIARGYVVSEDGEHLSLDGDDGTSHHAKSRARDMFEEICEDIRSACEQQEQPENGETGAAGVVPQSPARPQPPDAASARTGMAGIPTTPSPQQPPVRLAQPVPTPATPLARPQQPAPVAPQYGYAAQGQPMASPVAPGWVVESVPNKCTLYIMLSLGILFALAGIPFLAFLLLDEYAIFLLPGILIMSALVCWPAIVATIYSFSYRKAFMMGDGIRASKAMRIARGWLIASGCFLILLTILQVVSCS